MSLNLDAATRREKSYRKRMPMPANGHSNLAIDTVFVRDQHLILRLVGGMELRGSMPYLVREAAPEQVADWTLNPERSAVLWPRLDQRVTACDVAWDTICEQALGKLKQADWKLDALGDPAQREVVALWRLEADCYNGGFLQFFCNWGEANCTQALCALQTIGAAATLAIVRQQRAVLDRLENHPERKDYQDIYRLLTDGESALISDTLDIQLWDAMEEIPPLGVAHYFGMLTA